jgi:mannose-1-phosphate guanylyltransferase/mannose-6-phosphate isomerase
MLNNQNLTEVPLIPVIMAGGLGARLWPASRPDRPKQFLNFGGSKHTLFQQTVLRLRDLPKREGNVMAPIVVCNVEHRFLVAEQLQELGISNAEILLEPVGRNTAPALAVAALCAEQNHGPEAHLLVLAADHAMSDGAEFLRVVSYANHLASRGHLLTFGIVPSYIETGYGYIKRGDDLHLEQGGIAFKVAAFVEKPQRERAEEFLQDGGYYWNSGMFMFRVRNFITELSQLAPEVIGPCRMAWQKAKKDLDFVRLDVESFSKARNISVDCAVMEHTTHAVVIPLSAGWSDLGAWQAIWHHLPKDDARNAVLGDVLVHQTKDSLIYAQNRLVALSGVENLVVVETNDAILVADREHTQNLKSLVEQLKLAKRPEINSHKVVYRPWGYYETLVLNVGFQVKRITVKPGCALSLQLHNHRAEHWVVVKGKARVQRGEELLTLLPNESTYIPQQTKHRLENFGDQLLEIIEVQCGDYLGEDDIVRFEDRYNRDT